MQQLDIVDETIGTTSPEKRSLRASLMLDLDSVTAADLIRFRVENAFERGVDDPVLATRIGSATEAALNAPETTERGFSGVPASELTRIGERSAALDARIDAAAKAALAAFEAGTFLLIVNDTQVDTSNTRIPLKSVNEACFVRLLPLQGG